MVGFLSMMVLVKDLSYGEFFIAMVKNRSNCRPSVPKTRAQRALRAHKLARAYMPTRLTRLRALSRALKNAP